MEGREGVRDEASHSETHTYEILFRGRFPPPSRGEIVLNEVEGK